MGRRIELAMRSKVMFYIVLQLTFRIKSDLILQTLEFKRKPERARPVIPETHFVQFEGKLGEMAMGNTGDLFTQLKNQITGKLYEKVLDEL